MIKAIIFDFDGLVIETEVPVFQAIEEIYQTYGCKVPSELYKAIGSSNFDPYQYLESYCGYPINKEELHQKCRRRQFELVALQPVLPGVAEYIEAAKDMGLLLGIASSSTFEWVGTHLTRVDLIKHFDCIKCSDNVSHTKPEPELYITSLKALKLRNDEAIVLEDSPNGVLAAKRAGLFCVAVPSCLTKQSDFSNADIVLHSLCDMKLKDLLGMYTAKKA